MKIWITTAKEGRREIEIGDGCTIEWCGRDADHPTHPKIEIGTPWGFCTCYYDNGARMYAMKLDQDMPGELKFGQTSPMTDPPPGHKPSGLEHEPTKQ
jgi:hypothetical protein